MSNIVPKRLGWHREVPEFSGNCCEADHNFDLIFRRKRLSSKMLATWCGVTAGTSSKVQRCMFRLGLLDVAIAVCCTKVATTSDSRRRSPWETIAKGPNLSVLNAKQLNGVAAIKDERRSLKLPID